MCGSSQTSNRPAVAPARRTVAPYRSAARVGPQRRAGPARLDHPLEVPDLVGVDLAEAEVRAVLDQPVRGVGRADVDGEPLHVRGALGRVDELARLRLAAVAVDRLVEQLLLA